MEGVWWYNEGRSAYRIFLSESGLRYTQRLGDGSELFGELKALPEPSAWTYEAQLSNGASIRFRLQRPALVSSYKRADSSEWRPSTIARRSAGELGPLVEKNNVLPATPFPRVSARGSLASARPAGRQSSPQRGPRRGDRGFSMDPPKAVDSRALASRLRQAALFVFRTCDRVFVEEPLTAAMSSRESVLQAVPMARSVQISPLDLLCSKPLASTLPRDALEEHKKRMREQALKPDPKSTIVPVPAATLGLALAHPVSYNEEQMLRLFITDPRNFSYNLSGAYRMQVTLDARSAERAHAIVINRHDVLRSVFRQDDPTNPMRTVSRTLVGGIQSVTVATEGDAHMLQMMDRASAHQLGVSCMRATVALAHSNDVPLLGANIHHILSDADGMNLYFSELMQAAMLLSVGHSEEAVANALPRLPVQFIDFAYWQKSLESQGLLDTDLAYWYHEVVASTPPVVLDVPIDKPRPRVWYATGASVRLKYDNELLLPLSEVSGRATPMAVTCTNFAIVLSRMSGLPFLDVAIPFALRNMPALMNLIGNFLNMMPVRMWHDPAEPYSATLSRIATSNINVQKYSLGQFIQLVELTRKHFPVTDPARNPIYGTMIDLVPNETDEPSGALSGVLDVFLFVNTRQGVIWSLDAVYNTTILEAQTVKTMLLQMQAVARQAARSANEPVPRCLPSPEEAQAAKAAEIEVGSLLVRVGLLPHVVPLRSGLPVVGSASAEYSGIRRALRLKRHSCLEIAGDHPPLLLQSLKPPGPLTVAAKQATQAAIGSRGTGAAELSAKPRRLEAPARTGAAMVAGAPRRLAAATARPTPEQMAANKARSREVAARWAECQRVSELIPLDAPVAAGIGRSYLELVDGDSDLQLLQRGRQLHGRPSSGRAK